MTVLDREEVPMAAVPIVVLSLPWSRLAAGGAAMATVLAVAACGSSDTGGGSSGSGPTVSAKEFAFTPSDVAVSAGQSVTVTLSNQGSTEHSLTLDNGNGEVEAAAGQQARLTFTAPQSGSLTFHCKYHPTQMKGSFTVGGAAGAGGQPTQSSSSSSNGYGY
ncbi:MAG TPA: cupredoxin domain-containing protein [Candidatus Angelobacter sp.]|nr:cupredoxin domain-containing protein [Candidatus Angelobacter sp.]